MDEPDDGPDQSGEQQEPAPADDVEKNDAPQQAPDDDDEWTQERAGPAFT